MLLLQYAIVCKYVFNRFLLSSIDNFFGNPLAKNYFLGDFSLLRQFSCSHFLNDERIFFARKVRSFFANYLVLPIEFLFAPMRMCDTDS